jgi:hypothetical protein
MRLRANQVYGAAAARRLRTMGIRDKPIAPGSPWQNGIAERLIGSIRRECVDHLVVLGETHLRRVLKSYARYYNEMRTHRSLDKDAPRSRPVQRTGSIMSHALLGEGRRAATRCFSDGQHVFHSGYERAVGLHPDQCHSHPTAEWIARQILAHLYSAHCRERFLLPGHHGYPRASDLIRDKALEGRNYIKITDATVRPLLHLLNPTRRPPQESFGFCRR